MKSVRAKLVAIAATAASLVHMPAFALTDCDDLPDHAQLQTALVGSVFTNGTASSSNGGFDLNMWATIVNRDGEVCAVAFSGNDRGEQWPGSRVISAQKANTANAFSLPGLALSTANLWAATQPGGSLFGLQHSNPVSTAVAYGKNPKKDGDGDGSAYGESNDPMVGSMIGGVNVFGGGLALYGPDNELLGAIGVSGDTSCADHNVAWRVRDTLSLDFVPAGVGTPGDNIILDPTNGFGHPTCGGPGGNPDDAVDNLGIVTGCTLGDGKTPGCI